MSHFAQIDENNKVVQVVVIEQDVIDTGLFGDRSSWIKTSYNTHGGVHLLGGTPLRKNFASVGYIYDSVRDAFVPPKPNNGWILNETTCQWEAPMTRPTDGQTYWWNGNTRQWEVQNEAED